MRDRGFTTAGRYVERLAGNDYVQERLFEAVDNARAAYRRAAKRSAAQALNDRKVRRRVTRALAAGKEAATALQANRHRKRRRGKVAVLGLAALAAAGAAASGPVRRALSGRTAGPVSAFPSDSHTPAPVDTPAAA